MTSPSKPPVTDSLPVSLRAFAEAQSVQGSKPKKSKESANTAKLPASSWKLIFDCETTTHPGQALRFGAYQFRNGEILDESGIFYDPDGLKAGELDTLREYAAIHGLELRTRQAFVDEVFFARAYQLRATIVGFNLPFDISRLAIGHASARNSTERSGMRSDFTFKLTTQKIYPAVRITHMSQRAASISFAGTMLQLNSSGQRRRGLQTGIRRGHFIDVKTIAGALFARSFSLASLSEFLKIENAKLDFDDFDAPMSETMVRYAVRDVQATWECYTEVMAGIDRLKLTRTIPEKIFSEASIGKGYLREMGIQPWRSVQADFPRDLLAKIMGSYFGGRSEVRIRRQVRQVILCDFLSMYPTVCTLMGLWKFVIADGMTWRDTTDQTRDFLDEVDLEMLRSQSTWGQLNSLVRVEPNGDIFPVRAAYAGEAHTTIGANYFTSGYPIWFTLADCIAAKLLTGKVPTIIEAITFTPGPVQSGLGPIEINGNPDYRVDPLETDFFKRVIELRQSIKTQRDSATGDDYAALDTAQNALKIAINSTSYGIFIEVNVETRRKLTPTTVHSSTCESFDFEADKVEMPGTFFHPLLATLITGAARLMLAIAERLVIDKGLEWSFCDTDSMAIAKPNDMSPDKFADNVTEVVDWFTALNPYELSGSILQIEDVNGALNTRKPQPLFCLAISSKRYALFNMAADGSPVMRKVSAHGLGHLRSPYEEADAPRHLPTPHMSVLGPGIKRWHCDLWHQIVSATIAGHPDVVPLDYHDSLGTTAVSRYAATTPSLLRWFRIYNLDRPYRDQVKPFGFLLSMTQRFDLGDERIVDDEKRRPKKPLHLKPVAPFNSNHAEALASAFDRETGKPVPVSFLKTYSEALVGYHLEPESKFLNADRFDRGTTARRHVEMTDTRHIGKESNDWERQAMLGVNPDAQPDYGLSSDDRSRLAERLREFIAQVGMAKARKALRTTPARLNAILDGEESSATTRLGQSIAGRLPEAIRLYAKQDQAREAELRALREQVENDGLRATARRLATDPSNLRRRLSWKFRIRPI